MKLSSKRRELLQKDYATRWIDSASDKEILDLAYFAMMEKLDGMTSKQLIAFVETHDPEVLLFV